MTATRVDRQSQVETRLGHLSTPRGLLYVSIARPPGARSCVVICSSVFGDFLANYHRERTLARVLSLRGIGSIRFHYAGEGNSQGERRDMTFLTLCADAKAIVGHGMQSGFTHFALLGTRVGALVAAKIVASMPAVPLALWQPIIDPMRFFAEAHRAKRMSRLAQEDGDQAPDWQAELAKNGVLDLVGYDVYPAFIESIQTLSLPTLLGHQPRSVLIAHFSHQIGESGTLASELVERGFSVTNREFELSEAWWFDRETRPDSADLIPATAGWMVRVLGNRKDD